MYQHTPFTYGSKFLIEVEAYKAFKIYQKTLYIKKSFRNGIEHLQSDGDG